MAQTFNKRKGTTNQGAQYEILNVANIVLNFIQDDNIKNFHLSSNDETCGDFDDIVIDVETGKGREVYALQLKHKKNGVLRIKDLLKREGSFDIQKYFTSFKGIGHRVQKFILFTNLKCNIKVDKPFQLQGEDFLIKLIEVSPGDTVNISDRTNSCYKFVVIEKSPSETSIMYMKFFECFWLYTNQENIHQLEESVINKFKNRFAAEEIEFMFYLNFVTKWYNEDGLKEKLNKKWMQQTIALMILSSRIQPLSFEPINSKIRVFQEAIDEFDITVFEKDSCFKVVKLWGDANVKLCDMGELNQLRKKFQLFDRFITDIESIDISMASKLLWLMGICPLIVVGDETVYKVIQMCSIKKIILLDNNLTKYPQSFRTLSDLLDKKSEIFQKLIKTCTCSLQGKNKVSLDNLLKDNRKFLERVKTDDLLEMIAGDCSVGGDKENLPEPYIERFLSRIVIDPSYLESFKDDTVVIVDCVEKSEVLITKTKRIVCIDEDSLSEKLMGETDNLITLTNGCEQLQDFNSTIYYSKAICDHEKFLSIENKHKNINTHQFRFAQDGDLHWIRSKGNVNDLQNYKTDLLIEETKLFESIPKNYVNLIVADPGMGKSELMRSLKNNCSSDVWTVIISPKDVLLFCKKITIQKKFVKVFDEFVFNRIIDRDKFFFENCVEQNNVVYIWDALDEITDDQLKIVVKTIVELSLMKRLQWVTSRYHLKTFLESELSTVAFSLTQFDIQTQKLYIEKRLQFNNPNKQTEIFEKIRSTFVLIEHKNILGIPLQLFMVTELFIQNRKKYLALLNSQFVLTDLYYHFIQEKIKIYFVHKEDLRYESRLAESLQNDALKNLEKLALILLLPTEILKSLNVTVKINEQKKQDYLAVGLVTNFTNQIPRFIHNSFAEYLAAVFFSKNYHNLKTILIDILFESRFLNVRFFFDLLLAQDYPSHIAVLYKNINLLKSYESEIKTSKDDGGRNALHLACAWGQKHLTLKVDMVEGSYIVDDDYTSHVMAETETNKLIVEYLLNICDISDTDTVFNMKPLSYAQKCGNLLSEIKILIKQGINIFTLDYQQTVNILYYSTLLGYDELIDLFQTNNQEKNTCTILPIDIQNKYDMTLLHIASDRGYEKIVESLVVNGSQVNLGDKTGLTPLYVASRNGHKKVVEFLIANGSQINLANKNGLTPLIIACENNHENIVKLLVANGSQVNLAQIYGATPLYIACQKGHKKIVEFLVANGSDVNHPQIYGATPLYIASQNGYEEIVDFLIANGSLVNLPDKSGFTPLYVASRNGHVKIVEFLVVNGSQVEPVDKDGTTPLQVASENGYERIVEFLVANGSQVNLADKNGFTPLYRACQNGHTNIVKFLVIHGSEVNRSTRNGNTPLHIACQNGHEKIVDFLVTNGSKINATNKTGVSPLYLASQKGFEKIVEFLVVNGSQVDLADKDGFTPLYVASQNDHMKVVMFLVANGSQTNLAQTYGATPLYIACQNGHEQIVKFLVANGSQVNIAQTYGATPLYVASQNGHQKITEILLANGANVNHANKIGLTPLYRACENGHDEIVEILVANGFQVNVAQISGATPLYVASRNGYEKIVKFLVVNGSQVNLVNKNGFTPLFIASRCGHEKIVKFLVTNGSEVDLADKNGFTPLSVASQHGHDNIVEFLVANKSQINLPNKASATPLYLACRNGHDKIVKFLVLNGAKVNLANENGYTPLSKASANGHENIVNFLIANGSQVNLPDIYGVTPLHVAAQSGHKKIVETLVANGAQVNVTDKTGFTPLCAASQSGHEEVVQFLTANRSLVNHGKKNSFKSFLHSFRKS